MDVSSPKHGKVDPDNMPHVGGNTWAGGTGLSSFFFYLMHYRMMSKGNTVPLKEGFTQGQLLLRVVLLNIGLLYCQ